MYLSEKVLLGRWNLTYQKDHIDRKIYLANHDHCGPCGNIETLKKQTEKKKHI